MLLVHLLIDTNCESANHATTSPYRAIDMLDIVGEGKRSSTKQSQYHQILDIIPLRGA